jgi:hypothetical protein
VGDTGGRKPRKGYVCRACGSELHYIEDCPDVKDRRSSDKHSNQSRRVPHGDVGPDECWFCLSNPSIAKHLLVAVGGECYLTFPKGQLVPTHNTEQRDNERNFKVPGGGHVLIVPIAHFATLDTIPGELRASVMGECNRYIFTKHAGNAAYTPSPADIRQPCVHCTPNMARQLSSLRWAVFHPREATRTSKPYLYHFPLKIGSSPHSEMRVGYMVLTLTLRKVAHLTAKAERVIFGWSYLMGDDLCIE